MAVNDSLDWVELSIGDIADVFAGGTPKAGNPENFAESGQGIAWLTPADLSGYSDKYISYGARDLSQQGYDSSSAKLLPKGSLLFSSRAPIGYVAIAQNEISTNQGFKNFVFPYGVNSDYAYYFLRSIRDIAESLGTGTTFKEISGAKAKTLPFLLPPIAEQKVIAEKLDSLLTQVESTKARLERLPEILKRFRQSVLAAAVSGKLTEEWREVELDSRENKDELFEFREKPLGVIPDSWHWLRLDQVAKIASNLTDPSSKPDMYHIAPNHIESWTGEVSGFQTIKDDGVTSPKHFFNKGQILYSKIRPYLAKVTVAEFDGLCSADMYPIDSLINTQYLFRWMLTGQFTDWASNAGSRSVLPKINQKGLSEIPVPTPPLVEQTEIVRRVEELFAYADKIQQQADAALQRVNSLTQSILAKAFRGELTADWRAANPGLISGENSAEALLEKIKAERAAQKPKKKTRAKKA